jgi:hypothetical protein
MHWAYQKIRLDFLIRVQTSKKEKFDTTSNLYKLMFAWYRDAQVANISEVGGHGMHWAYHKTIK